MPRPPVQKYVHDTIKKYDPGNIILDAGAGPEPNYYAPLFPGKTFHRLDVEQNETNTIDYIADLYALPADLYGQYTTVLSLETLEHLPFPALAIRNMTNLLKPGGLFILSSITSWPIHRHPKDYWRFLPDGFELLLSASPLKILEIKLEKEHAYLPGGIFAAAQKI
ncbi:MAG: methyltransferase domain-containing protein [Candidatus Omnitrophica bacterium]|nr:methyltransferase domain-containing protein [Candidatus Omnitrophota bacterium]